MPISFIASAQTSGNFPSSLSVPSHAAGDLLVLFHRAPTTPATPSGWTSVATFEAEFSGQIARVSFVKDTGNTITSVALGGGSAETAAVLVYRDAGTPSNSATATAEPGPPQNLPTLTLAGGGESWVFAAAVLNQTVTASSSALVTRHSYATGPNIGGGEWIAGDTDGGLSTWSGESVTWSGGAYAAAVVLEIPYSPPPVEARVLSAGPLGVASLTAHHQFGRVQAAGPLGAPAIVAAQYYASMETAGPLGVPAVLAHHQAAQILAAGPLGPPQILAAQQLATVQAPGPLGTPKILATFPVVATVQAAGPLGAPRLLAWHDFTTALTGSETSRYLLDLITPGGTVRVPMSSWQATLQTDAAGYVQAVIPAAGDYLTHILAATEFVITRATTLASGDVIEYEMARSPVESIAPSQGPTNYTVVLSGYPDALTANDNPPTEQDRTLAGVRSVAGLAGAMRVRCSIDWLLRPGMRAYQGSSPILVDYVNYYVNTSDQYMDVGERA